MSGKINRKKISLSIFVVFVCLNLSNAFAVQVKNDVREKIKEAVSLVFSAKSDMEANLPKSHYLKDVLKNESISEEEYQIELANAIVDGLKVYEIKRYDIEKIYECGNNHFPKVNDKTFKDLLWSILIQKLEEPLEIKIATLAPEGTAWLKVPKEVLVPHLTKISKGKIKIELYTGGIMGEDGDVIRKIEMGQLDGCGCTALGVFKAAPEVAVVSLPLLFRDYDEVDHILTTFRRKIDSYFESHGLILAALIDTGFFNIYSTNKIESFDELKSARIMTWFGDIEAETYKMLDINPTPISVPEVTSSINTGLIDACVAPAPWILGTQVYPKLRYIVSNNLFYSPAAIFVSDKIFSDLKGDFTKKELLNIAEIVIYEISLIEKGWIHDECRPFEKKCLDAFYKYGIKKVTFSDEEMIKFETAAKKVWYDLADKLYPKTFLEDVLKELESYRKR